MQWKIIRRIETLLVLMVFFGNGCDVANDLSPRGDGEEFDGDVVFAGEVDGNMDIYLLDIENGVVLRLTEDEARDYEPTPSPDGNWIAFTSLRDGIAQVYIVSADGKQLIRMYPSEQFEFNPCWNHRGDRLAFVSFIEQNRESDEFVHLTDGMNCEQPRWVPDD